MLAPGETAQRDATEIADGEVSRQPDVRQCAELPLCAGRQPPLATLLRAAATRCATPTLDASGAVLR